MIHVDATYFGRHAGVLVAIEATTGKLLYANHIEHESLADYIALRDHIVKSGYRIESVVIDGTRAAYRAFDGHKIQMCMFHMVAIIRRKLTGNPTLAASNELLHIAYGLKRMSKDEYEHSFEEWQAKWRDFLKEKTVNAETGRETYTHRRLRSAKHSLGQFAPYLFTFEGVCGMPRTNNRIEGVFKELKAALRAHPGISESSRNRLIRGFFLAYLEKQNKTANT